MMKSVSTKDIVVIVALALVIASVGSGIYFYLLPQTEKKEREISALRAKTSGIRADLSVLTGNFEKLEERKELFAALQKDGFFSKQGRSDAARYFKTIEAQSGVLSAVAQIGKGEIVRNDSTEKIQHVILTSPVSIEVSALQDVYVQRYIDVLRNTMPGHIAVQKIAIARTASLDSSVLKDIADGKDPVLVVAEIDILWSTLIPDGSDDAP